MLNNNTWCPTLRLVCAADVHLDCEKSIADFLGTQEAILYSDGLACVSSVIPAFSKADDLIIWSVCVSPLACVPLYLGSHVGRLTNVYLGQF